MDIALYQPDIPQNTGTILRLGACLGLTVHIIGPAGFSLADRALRRAGLDYLERARLHPHDDWGAFVRWRQAAGRRLVLLTTGATRDYTDLIYRKDDILLCGQESGGVPPAIHGAAGARVRIPMVPGARSLNVAVAVAMVAGEALRQLDAFSGKGAGERESADGTSETGYGS
ncbi:MAG: tRNA (cytidine(34)-2'-O)-methyltransferase [Alphaproteobacteria bacterium]|nr:MAG: tRNA (cytidine(34)-2'-O)-methyltransferase [Alphaproteobacteria bacterium]